MKNKISYSIIFSMLSILCSIAVGQEITGSSGKFVLKIEKNFKVEPGGSLVIEGVNGNIIASSWNKLEIEIKEEIELKVYTKNEAEEILHLVQESYSQQGNQVTIDGQTIDHVKNRTFTVAVPEKFNLGFTTMGGDISASNITGDVKMKSMGGDISLKNISGMVQASTAGGDLDFNTISGKLNAHTAGGDVVIGEMLGECDISTAGGDIDVDHATSLISLDTAGGSITMKRIEGNLSAKTMGGDLNLSSFSGKEATLKTMGGEIDLQDCKGATNVDSYGGDISGRNIESPIAIKTMGGEIELVNLQAEAKVESMGGDVTIEMTLTDFKKPHGISVDSRGGEITVTLPSIMPATISAEIRFSRRDWSNRNYDIYSDFPLSKSTLDETDKRILRSTGEINNGGDSITLKTMGGDIYIKKGK